MNFQAARNSPGEFIQMQGTAVKFDIKQGDYGNYALGKMADDTGAVEKMFYAASEDSPLPDESVKNKLAVWGIRFDANKRQFKAYFNGYVQQGSQQSQQPQNVPQNSPQAPQQPAQRPNLPDTDIVTLRAYAFNAASLLHARGKIEYRAMFFEADIYLKYIQNGTHPTGVAGANPPGTMDDFPQEPGSRG